MLRNSVPDKLDSTYIEFAIFALWRINIVNYIRTKAALAKNFHIQPSELDAMPYWEYEYFIKEINDMVENENKDQQAQMDKYNVDERLRQSDPKHMNKVMSGMTKMKAPSINMGSMKMH